ncbi:MAG: SpoIID/LytB domain-containing protein [Candidatus Caenarcaniphilales bacterium]|nr:SpoIID/LytB domain-containing protein [Candidatus Caenarcaniphilales bacterium]
MYRTIVFLILIVLAPLASYSAPTKIDKNFLVRIGIVLHFGQSASDRLTFKPADPDDKLVIEFLSQSGESCQEPLFLDELKLATVSAENIDCHPLEKIIVAGHYLTYETAQYYLGLLRHDFPEYDWQSVYPHPWQLRAYTDQPGLIVSELKAKGFRQAQIKDKPATVRQLEWLVGDEKYQAKSLTIRSRRGGAIKLNSGIYPGTLEIRRNSFGSYVAINQLPIEEYLRGVVPFEIGAGSPIEALETQAILARTYTLANLDRFEPEGYHLCATQACQVYKGVGATNARIDQAIAKTSSQVLKNNQKQIAPVFYYSTDGGYTADFGDIWKCPSSQSGYQFLKAKSTCPGHPPDLDLSREEDARRFLTSGEALDWNCYDQISPRFRWKKEITLKDLTAKMIRARNRWKYNWSKFGEVKDLQVTKRSRSGRILELEVNTDSGAFSLELDEIRAAFGGLDSTFFVIDPKTDPKGEKIYVFSGAGFGHGVGLSQYGARALASQHKTTSEILHIYFPHYYLDTI